jgi:hypothetical protein
MPRVKALGSQCVPALWVYEARRAGNPDTLAGVWETGPCYAISVASLNH